LSQKELKALVAMLQAARQPHESADSPWH